MNRHLIKYIALVLSMVFILSLVGCKQNKTALKTFLPYDDADYEAGSVSTGVVCENDRWRLCWDNSKKRVSFEDKLTGAVWGQIPSEAAAPVYNEEGILKKNHPQLESVLQVIFQDPKSFDDVTAYSYTGAFESDGIYSKKIKNGIEVVYDYIENEFCVPVDFTINEDTFSVSVDPTKISEGEEYKIHSIALAPFLCGVKNNSEDSWLFLPDGTGTVVNPVESDGVGTVGEQYVYGKDLSYQSYSKPAKTEQINFPVFGAKKGNNAVLGIITSGGEKAALEWNIGSSNIGYSSIYPEFRIRGFNYIKRPENYVTTTTLGAFKIFSDGITTDKISIEYHSLSGEKASISGMAECYRDYLIKNKNLQKSTENERYATLRYIGAAVQPSFILGIPSQKLFALTTTKQALGMTDEISKKVGNNLNVDLVGFGKSGINVEKLAGGFTVANKLGGKAGMKKLVSDLDKKGINSFVDFDIISFSKSGGGFSKKSSAAYHGGQVVKYTSFDNISGAANSDRFFVLSRDNLKKASRKVLAFAKKTDISGISYSSLSKTVYSDYSKQKYYISGKIEEDVSKIFNNAQKSGYKVLSSGANVYAAINSDYVSDVPLYSSGYVFSSYDVPFYQLVFKGYRPMSSVSVNLCPDKKDALLRCVSYGISPSYTLYANYDSELATSEYRFVFGSEYDGNKEDVISEINSVKNYLKSVDGASITDFKRLKENVTMTSFDNGVRVIVNFSENNAATEYGSIGAKSFVVSGGSK